ncbi:MAG: hypothetical protein EP347_00360 [Alphaproteobacteria bacterium]|nr:MAG: hypothetical protein EP347_00360 [Alphaproteobacteria bacterium]
MSFFLRLAISPIFFLLGFVSYGAERSVGSHLSHLSQMAGMDHATMAVPVEILGIGLSQNTTAILTSMWLMYVLMGLAHLSAWLDVFAGRKIWRSDF